MPYNNAIPAATDRINASQPQILTNFQEIQNIIGVNHVTFNGLAPNIGKHEKVVFPLFATAPVVQPPAFAIGDIGLYNYQNAATSPTPELYIRRNAAVTGLPITINNWVIPGAGTNCWTYLPSGLLIKWGQRNQSGVSVIVTFAGPMFAQLPYVTLSLIDPLAGGVSVHNLLVGQFESHSTVFSAATYVNYIAIGISV